MARLRLLHSEDPESLLLSAAAPLLQPGRPPEPLPLLVLRQGALRDEVLERAARAGCVGWLGRPVVVFAELPQLLAGETAPLHPREREVLLGRLAREHGLSQLQRLLRLDGLARALDSLIGDLLAERVEPEALEAALATLPRGEWEERRDWEVVRLYQLYRTAIESLPAREGLPRSDGRDGLARAAECVRDQPDAVRRCLRRPFREAGERRTIAICGLSDLRRGWRLLIEALHAADFVDELRIYLPSHRSLEESEPLSDGELWEFLGPRADEIEALPAGSSATGLTHLHDALFRLASEPLGRLAEVQALAAPDPQREVAEIARRIKRLILETGAEPHRIAVISRQSRPYAPLMTDALRRVGVPVSARLRTQLHEVPAVGAILGVFHAAAEGWTARALLQLSESPYFDLELDPGLIRRIASAARPASLASWEAAYERLAKPRPEEEESDSMPSPERTGPALVSFRAFRAAAERFGAALSLSAWLDLTLETLGEGETAWEDGLWNILRRVDQLPGNTQEPAAVEVVRLDRAALDVLPRLLRSWKAALALDPEADLPRTPAEWCRELEAALEAEEVVLRTPHQRGVQVTEALAALGRPWEHAFLVGMSTGAFPAEPARNPLYGDEERAALRAAGLPLETAEVWFAREAGLFRSLVATARQGLHLSYAYADAEGAARLPSAYFDETKERLVGTEEGEGEEAWAELCPGSRLVPEWLEEIWCEGDLRLFATRAWREETHREEARTVLAHLLADAGHATRTGWMLENAATEWQRRQLRAEPRESRSEHAHPWNGRISDPELLEHLQKRFGDAVWSVSRLESYGYCPWSFFAQHVLGLEAAGAVEDDLDAAARGSLLHRCLERLHRRLVEEFGDEALDSAHLARAEEILAELVPAVVAADAEAGWTGADELRVPRERELLRTLRRYVRWEMEQNSKAQRQTVPRRVPRHIEISFGQDGEPPALLRRGGRELRLRGRIDRVDVLLDPRASGWLYVVDHKSGRSGLEPLGRYDEGALLHLPLYMQAVRQIVEDGPGVWGGAYQVIGSRERRAALHPRSLTQKGITAGNKTQLEAAERIDSALEHAFAHSDSIAEGYFPARIPECCMSKGCPSYCDYGDICREDVRKETRA